MLSNVADVASLFGLLVSFYVLYTVAQIRNRYLLTARLPSLLTALRRCSSEFSTQLSSYPASDRHADEILARTVSVLRNTARKTSRPLARTAKSLTKAIASLRKAPDIDKAWKVYSDLQAYLEDLKQLQA